jgi:tRNA A-37 threonylcarbamoyl transferase component Bud32
VRIAEETRAIYYSQDLHKYGVHSEGAFQFFWDHKGLWVEQPNRRRGGWSGVYKIELQSDDGEREILYVKKHHAHRTRSVLGIGRKHTLEREYNALCHAHAHAIGAPELVFFGMDGEDCILATRALDGLGPVSQLRDDYVAGQVGMDTRRQLARNLGTLFAKMHGAGMRHSDPHGDHLLANLESGATPALIDWEMASVCLRPNYNRVRDLAIVGRSLRWATRTDIARFLHAYFGVSRLGWKERWRIRQLQRRIHAKDARERKKALKKKAKA